MVQSLPEPAVGEPVAPLAYRVITGPDDSVFCERVSELMQQGYVPTGPPALTSHEGGIVVAQGMVYAGEDDCCGEGCCG